MLKRFKLNWVLLYIPIYIMVALSFWFAYQSEAGKITDNLYTAGSKVIDSRIHTINRGMLWRVRDLDFVIKNAKHHRLCSETLPPDGFRHFVGVMHLFAQNRSVYDQIRWIDSNGKERFRINSRAGKIETTPLDQLQDKNHRYYVQDINRLKPGQYYLSALDLNMEHGSQETPPVPTIRIATPITNLKGNPSGFFILNYKAEALFNRVREQGNGHMWLLDNNGSWLLGPNHSSLSELIENHDDLSFSNQSPNVWGKISAASQGSFEDQAGIWIHKNLFPLSKEPSNIELTSGKMLDVHYGQSSYPWRLIYHVPRHEYEPLIEQIRLRYALFTLLAFLVISFVLWAHLRSRRIEHAAMEKAQRASRAKSKFLSSMSHELRTPLNAILGFSQILELDKSLTAQQKSNVAEISQAGRHLLELINEILDLSKIESGHIELTLLPIKLHEIFTDCLKMVQPMADEHNIDINSDGLDEYTIYADYTRFKQSILNLLSNAIKYNRKNGMVTINTQPAGDGLVRILVTDTGIGIPEREINKLFEPFHRIPSGDSNIEGTGIGLVITRSFVEIMGGQMGVDSIEGSGSTFWIELPAYQTEPDLAIADSPEAAPESA